MTLGDPTGVGPEVVAKTLTHREIYERCRPLTIGSLSALRRIIQICKLNLDVRKVTRVGVGPMVSLESAKIMKERLVEDYPESIIVSFKL